MTSQYDKFVFMKVGRHAGEDFNSILDRKREEYRQVGMSFWGFGGPTCHPVHQVRPFAREVVSEGGRIYLVMETIESRADPDIIPATEYSEDGVIWKPIPDGIRVTGSRYAVVLGEIREEEFELPLCNYSVALGNSEGRSADEYLQGRVDKACLKLKTVLPEQSPEDRVVGISHVAEVIDPYAVLLRGGEDR